MEEISATATNVLITGESGTGKELVANAIHYNSPRVDGPFITINCAALPDNLLESELFGHVKGAFTGATKDRKGLFETALEGTLFLDEIGDISLTMQAKLLRVLQEGEYVRVGESIVRKTNARIIAATNQDLQKKIESGGFRQDLYYRLSVFTIHLPALRERKDDIPMLIDHFREEFNKSLDRNVKRVSDVAMEHLINYNWHGNIRELKNFINGAMILCHKEVLEPRHFHPDFFQSKSPKIVKSFSKEKTPIKVYVSQNNDEQSTELVEALEQNFWNITKTARQLGISRTYIYKKLKEYKIQVPR